MKQILITNLAILLILGINSQIFAQKDKKEKDKTVKLKMEKMVDGKKIVTDTTFTLKKGEDLNKVLEKYGVNDAKNSGIYKIKAETGDSTKHKEKQMVWVNMDSNGDQKQVRITQNGKEKTVIISDDADVQILDDEDLIVTTENSNDTVKHIRKIIHYSGSGNAKEDTIIWTEKGKRPKQHKIKKVYKFNGDSLNHTANAFFFSDMDKDINKVIIKELEGDSLEVFISKIIGKGFVNQFDMPFNENFGWNAENDFVVHTGQFKHQSAKVKLDSPVDVDLNLLKLEKNYRKLDLDEFMVVFNGLVMDLSFISNIKGDLSVNIYDEKGNSSVVIELKGFQGKFEKEIKLQKGNQILQITQNKKHFVKKLRLE